MDCLHVPMYAANWFGDVCRPTAERRTSRPFKEPNETPTSRYDVQLVLCPVKMTGMSHSQPRRKMEEGGRYSFSLPEPLAHGQLRSLRNPNDPAEQVFDLVAATA
jgi:hypothetical protein